MDMDNPAIAKQFEIPPALVDAVHDDPLAIQPAARVMAFKLLHEQFVDSPNYTPAQKLALSETLAKVGRIDGKTQEQVAQGAGFSVVINIPGSTKGVTVEGVATRIQEEVSEA